MCRMDPPDIVKKTQYRQRQKKQPAEDERISSTVYFCVIRCLCNVGMRHLRMVFFIIIVIMFRIVKKMDLWYTVSEYISYAM